MQIIKQLIAIYAISLSMTMLAWSNERSSIEQIDGRITIEAEDFDDHRPSTYSLYKTPHEWVLDHEHDGYSGRGYLRVAPDERGEDGKGPHSPRDTSGALLRYRIHVNRPGTHHVFVRGRCLGGESNGLHVGVNGMLPQKEPGASNISGFRPAKQWNWENHRKHGYEGTAIVELAKGTQTLCVWSRDDGFCFDKLVLVHEDMLDVSSNINAIRPVAAGTSVAVRKNRILIDGREQSLWGVRVASGAIDNQSTNELLEQLPSYKAAGINAITVYYMGSSGGHADPFLPDGSDFRPGQGTAIRDSMDRLIAKCDSLGMVIIPGIFYQWKTQERSKRFLRDWEATKRATRTVAEHLGRLPHRNVILNIANEQGSGGYRDEPWGRVREVDDLLSLVRIAKTAAPNLLIGAGGYDHKKNLKLGQSNDVDLLLFDTLGPDRQEHSGHWHDQFSSASVDKPMINVEIFGAWTSQFLPPGVYPAEARDEHFKEIDQAHERPGLNIFFHSNPWFQGPSVEQPLRFVLGGDGTSNDPGVRWFFERVQSKSSTAIGPSGIQRPNVVIIMADDMGFSDLSCYGSEIPTPNLDALAENGLRYTQFYNTGRCCPTRAALMTGLYAHRAGVGMMTTRRNHPGYQGTLNDQCVTIGRVASDAGYLSICSGKWHLGSRKKSMWPTRRGFDHFYGIPEGGGIYKRLKPGRTIVQDETTLYDHQNQPPKDWYCVDAFTEQAIAMASEAVNAGQPFLLYLPHIAPHFPVQADASDIEPLVDLYAEGYDELNRQRIQRQRKLGLLSSEQVPASRPKDVPAWKDLTPQQQHRFARLMATYAGVVTRMDTSVGRLVQWLRDREQFDNTVILFLSDNGGSAESGVKGRTDGDPTHGNSNWWIGKSWAWLCNAPFKRFKMDNDEGGIATPLIIHWPNGIQKPGWRHNPGHVIDIMPTIVELTGGNYPPSIDTKTIAPMAGHSLVPTFSSENGSKTIRSLGWEHMGNAAFRHGDWKIVRSGAKGTWRLYDLSIDRTENSDLASQYPERTTDLIQRWLQWASKNNVATDGLPR